MKKSLFLLLSLLICTQLFAQEKVLRIHLANGKYETKKVSDILKITIEDEEAIEWPQDSNPPVNGYLKSEFTEGELMYYGKDAQYSSADGAIYFLYLKDLSPDKDVNSSVCFYVNVPRQTSGKFELPEGTYTADDTWEIGTFNNNKTAKYVSNWNVIDPKWTNYRIQDGEFIVEKLDSYTYSIKGRVKGGSIQDDNTLYANEYGIEFTYTGPLPVEDYSSDYEEPENPGNDDGQGDDNDGQDDGDDDGDDNNGDNGDGQDDGDDDGDDNGDQDDTDTTEYTELTKSALYYYGDNIYYLNLKDDNTDLTATLYLTSEPQNDNLVLQSGTYKASTESPDNLNFVVGTSGSSRSFCTIKDEYGPVKYFLKSGEIKISVSGTNDYAIKATVVGIGEYDDDEMTFSFSFTGSMTAEDYSY